MLRSIGVLVAALLLGSAAPAATAQTPDDQTPDDQTPAKSCTVTAGALEWGFKESFRAYIDGSIANGEWTATDGASYATPSFTFPVNGFAALDAGPAGVVPFGGAVRFTGHGGVLDTTVANPVLEFGEDGDARLLLDVSGPTMDGEQVAVTGAPFVDIDLGGQSLSAVDGVLAITEAPTVLTEEGAAAFPNYEAGADFDPVSVRLEVAGDCDLAAEPTPQPVRGAPGSEWLVPTVLLLGLAAAAAIVGVVFALTRRR